MTTQQTIIACTAALILTITGTAYSFSDRAFWKPQESWEKWCEEEGLPWTGIPETGECMDAYLDHEFPD